MHLLLGILKVSKSPFNYFLKAALVVVLSSSTCYDSKLILLSLLIPVF